MKCQKSLKENQDPTLYGVSLPLCRITAPITAFLSQTSQDVLSSLNEPLPDICFMAPGSNTNSSGSTHASNGSLQPPNVNLNEA